ncbi:MAG TPA: SURF1 family protein [Nocardioidaceae bacterium]|nr:SURF1 family protein [Nocardioidaceae bacterium]
MFGFLLTRRWVLFALFVAVLGVICWRLGVWQFDRLDERLADNEIIERNLAAEPVDVREVMSPEQDLPASQQWRTVTLHGEYVEDAQVLVRYQTRDGRPGVSVVTPLRLDDGTRVLVERGWAPAPNSASAEVDVPPPPEGEVQVTGWARQNQNGDPDAITPKDAQVRLISSAGFIEAIDAPLLHGYVSLESSQPAEPLAEGTQKPELNSGPHFFYGLQWWFFAALAIGGFGYFVWVESRDPRRDR